MKLVTFRTDARDRAGIVCGDAVLDLANGFAWLGVRERYGASVLAFIEHAEIARPSADELSRAFGEDALPRTYDGRILVHALADVSLRAPIPRPPSMRDGYAFRQHVETARKNRGLDMIPEFDQFPVFYFTNHLGVVGPGEVHVRPRHLDKLDYELEAAVVVGTRARDLDAQRADRAIFGLTIMNDWSARGLQMEEMKLNLGPAKGKDFATSLGPWLVTADELAPYARAGDAGTVFDMPMRARVGDEELSRGNLKDMRWTFAQILERASYGVMLEPGDVVGSGTCGTGCLLELNGSKVTHDRWLKPGEKVTLEIEGLGRLENTIVLDED